MEADTKAAAFFDLDRTLISGSSLVAFGLSAWRTGLVPTRDVLQDLGNSIVYRLQGAGDERTEAVKNRVLAAIKGQRQEDLKALGRDVIPKLLKEVRLESQGLVDLHHDSGRDTYIISASPVEIVESLAEAMGMTGGIGTLAEVKHGVYTGGLAAPFCYGQGKAEAISKLAVHKDYDLRLCYAYTDSAGDLPMLDLVGHPVAVNPDRPLQQLAYVRGWPIVEFSRRRKLVIKRTTALAATAGAAAAAYVVGRRQGMVAGKAAALAESRVRALLEVGKRLA